MDIHLQVRLLAVGLGEEGAEEGGDRGDGAAHLIGMGRRRRRDRVEDEQEEQ